MKKLISINNLSYRPKPFPSDKPDILQDINLDIEEGSFVAIIGRNGSGKTTLIKHINGLLFPSRGKVEVAGLDTRHLENHPKLRSLVGMVFQNPSDQIVASTVEEDVAFGLENLNLPSEKIQKEVYGQLEKAGLLADAKRPPHLLSGGQIQGLALAGVLARHPKIILFDEPTSMLDPLTRNAFLDRVLKLRRDGMTILYITQHMEEAFLADKIIVIDDGKIVLTGSREDVFKQRNILYEIGLNIPVAAAYAQALRDIGLPIAENIFTPDALLDVLPDYQGNKPDFQPPSSDDPSGEMIINLQNVHYTYLAGTPLSEKALQGADLEVQEGAIQGIVGTNGSGKSTLLMHINGLLRPSQGMVRVAFFDVEDPATSLREIVKKVGLVFQNPEAQFFEAFVGDEIAFGPKQFELDNIRERVNKAMALVGLDFEAYKDRRLETLSGGEKRKVALASTLILDQEILLFDEPTAGMDPKSRYELLALFKQLQRQGKTILIASHRLDEIAQISNALSVMKSGRVVKTSPTHDILFNKKTINESGLSAPLIVEIVQILKEKGWPIECNSCLSIEQLTSAMQEMMI
ncbi:MAG: energy-coupling factor transporter ATPase [Chloroflexota bacterium]|nr:energy-coupling factor transporter ATPase [Chloroflexota bacterium]